MVTTTKGHIGVAKVTADLLKQGFSVLVPVSAASPYDLAICKDSGHSFCRIQVKYAKLKSNGALKVNLLNVSTGGKKKRVVNLAKNLDVVAIYCPDTEQCYYIPFNGRGAIHLRVKESKNGQEKGIVKAQNHTKLVWKT